MSKKRADDAETCLVYITASDQAEAQRIARAAVEEKLAACANIFGAIQSIYRWDGAVCEGDEIAFILKTSAQRKVELVERVRQLHSYDCPCIICLPVVGGNSDFLKWIENASADT